MSKHDEARRAFLIGAAVGAGAVAGAGLVPDALAQYHEQHAGERPSHDCASACDSGGHGAFLNDDDAATVAAFTERLMPGAPGKPGARDAGVLNYIDLALAGAYEDLQDFYRRGLASLDAYCRKTYNAPFVRLDAARQDEVITALEQGKATGFTWPTRAGVLQHHAHAHDGRHVRRPDLRRQQGLRGLAPGGLPWRATAVLAGGYAEQRSVHACAHHRPASAGPNAEGMSHGNRKD